MSLDNNRNLKFIKNRSCTNCCFLFVFIFFLIGWGAITFFAFKYGDPERVFLPTDKNGSICGRGSNVDKPFLFYFNILKCAKLKSLTQGCDINMVCVSQCPNYTVSYSKFTKKDIFDRLDESEKSKVRSNLICKYEVAKDFQNSEIPGLLTRKQCASVYIKSEPRFGRCLPSELKTKKNQLIDDKNKPLLGEDDVPLNAKSIKDTSKAFAITFNAKALGELILDDILTAKWFIIAGLIAGMIVSLIWILLMQVISGFMVWTSMIVLIFLSGFFSIFSYKKYKFFKSLNSTEIDMFEDMDLEDTLEFDLFDLVKVQLNSILFDSRVWLASTIISVIVFFLLFVTFIALRQRVRIAISLIKEASKAIMEAKFTLIFPLFPYVFHLLVIVFSVVNTLLIVATYKPAYRFQSGPFKGQYCDPKEDTRTSGNCTIYQLLDDKYVFWVQGYNLFGFIWALFFIHGMCQLIFAGVFSRYYWTPNKKKHLPEFLILNSTYTAFRYHIGSIALGSFFLATVKILQIILEYIDRKCKQYANNPVAKGIIWCFRCCFWVLDNFLRYINTNAYIMIAVYGKGYFASAKDAFNLILNNIIRAVIIDKVADYLLFFGKLSVTGIMGFATYYIIENYQSIPIISDGKAFPTLHYAYLPVVIISIGTYLVASTFFSVYEMAVNTIFLCFLKDCQENDGSQDKPYFMSKGLLKILNYQNKLSSESLTGTKSDEKQSIEDQL